MMTDSGKYQWPATEIHGPITFAKGGEYHLDSYIQYTKTEVTINGAEI